MKRGIGKGKKYENGKEKEAKARRPEKFASGECRQMGCSDIIEYNRIE